MDALIMAGGMGERMASEMPKPLVQFNGKPLIQWVFEAVSGCAYVDRILIAITRATQGIKDVVEADLVVTKGEGYVGDMVSAIAQLGLKKTLVVSADLPLITSADLTWVVEEYHRLRTPAVAVFVPIDLCKKLGVTYTMEIGGLVPAGVNIVDGNNIDGEESRIITSNPGFAFNINTADDLERALQFARNCY